MGDLSSRRVFAFFSAGFVFSLAEPIFLLLTGSSIVSALWPMANRTLEWTFTLREIRSFLFGIFLILIPISFHRRKKASVYEKLASIFIAGASLSFIMMYILLNYAYIRDAFVLLPTTVGFTMFCAMIIGFDLPKNPFQKSGKDIKNSVKLVMILFSVWLFVPGLPAMAGLLPSPPELEFEDGKYNVETTSYEYPMPENVSSIQGDYEADVVFSVYISKPVNYQYQMPLAIILHGFASPQYESYIDWVEEMSSRGVVVAYVQYPSDVMPPGYDNYTLLEQYGMSNHPFHLPRAVAINAALDFMVTKLPDNTNTDNLLVGGHSLGAGYAFLALDWALDRGWANESLFVDLESPYARPVQDHLQPDLSRLPSNFIAHVAITEDDMSVNDCFGVYHQKLLGEDALFIEIPSDRYGFPRLVASHYLQATETHDTLADWGFYRRVALQSNWLVANTLNEDITAQGLKEILVGSPELTNMGVWSDGKSVEELRVFHDAINHQSYDHCKKWEGP